MKHIMPTAALLLFSDVQGQNLVPNWSFEEYTECPTSISQFTRSVAWDVIGGSPDLFSSCSSSDTVNVPLNFLGEQGAFHGSAYAGVGTGHIGSKEFIQGQLVAPIIPGLRTYVTMRVSPGGFGITGLTSPVLASSGIGLRLSVQPLPVMTDDGEFDFNSAIVNMSQILDDTISWTLLSTDFIASDSFRFVQIGNFFDENLTLFELLDENGDAEVAYAFLDAICVSQADGGCDELVAVAHTNDGEATPVVTLSPDGVCVVFKHEPIGQLRIELLDCSGRLVNSVYCLMNQQRIVLPTSALSSGVFWVSIISEGHRIQCLPIAVVST